MLPLELALWITLKLTAEGNNFFSVCIILCRFISVEPELFYLTTSPMEVVAGGVLNITCGIRGNPLDPLSDIKWTKIGGGTMFNESKSTYFKNSSITYGINSLSVLAATKNDYGVYVCTGTNKIGTIHKNVSVSVQCKPSVVLHCL